MNEATLAFLKSLDLETSGPTQLSHEERYLILQKGIRALAAALETTVKPKENNK